jgi:hypothetical protein
MSDKAGQFVVDGRREARRAQDTRGHARSEVRRAA